MSCQLFLNWSFLEADNEKEMPSFLISFRPQDTP